MTKIVVNRCFGGFGLSKKAVERYAELSGFKIYSYKSEYLGLGKNLYTRHEGYEEDVNIIYSKKDLGDYPKELIAYFRDSSIERDDPMLIMAVEELGEEANNFFSSLEVVEIPDDVKWEIDEYDGSETIHEVHRSW